jgi:hypothetical protein
MTDREIQQAMDVCRPGGEDLRQPEMAALAEAIRSDPEVRRRFERSQRFDAVVTGMFRDVPVPDGLENRLLAAIESVDIRPPTNMRSAASELLSPDSTSPEPDTPAQTRSSGPDIHRLETYRNEPLRRKRRRVWTIVAGSLTAVAALVGFLLIPYFGAGEPRPDDRLPGEVLAWTDAVVRQGWKTDLQAEQLRDRPLDRVVRASPQRWCSITTPYDSQTVVYDLASRGGDLALVFCMRSRVRGSTLPEIPPWNAYSATGGLTLGVWRRGDMVYVLVVRGGTRRYRELIEAPPLIG